jgi:hypothetical protein
MAVTLNVKWSGARPIPNFNHHYIPIFYEMSGATQYEKNINGGSWIDVNVGSPVLDGKVVQWTPQHAFYTFGLRDKNNPSDTAFVAVEVPYITNFPEETDTPLIVTTSISSGANKTLTIKSKNPYSLIRLYSSELSGTEGIYTYPFLVIAQGTSDANGQCILTIPSTLRTNQFLIPTAQDEGKNESLATNKITVGGTRINQLNISYTQGQNTATGRLLLFNITGGTAPYQYSTNNDGNYTTITSTPIDYPYGIDWIVVKDATNAIFAFTVKVFNETTVISNPKFLSTYTLIPEIVATKEGKLIQLSKRRIAPNVEKFYYVTVKQINQRLLDTARVGEIRLNTQDVPLPLGWTSSGGSSGNLAWDEVNTQTTCNTSGNLTTFVVAVTGNAGAVVEFQFDTNSNWIPANVAGQNGRFTITVPSDGLDKQFKARVIGQTNFLFGSRRACEYTPPSTVVSTKIYPSEPSQAPFYYINNNPVQFKSKVQVSGLRIWDEAWALYKVGMKRWTINNGVQQSGTLDFTLPSDFSGETIHVRILIYKSSTITDQNIEELNDYVFYIG